MSENKHQFAIDVLRYRRNEIRQNREFTPGTAKVTNELTEAIEVLLNE